MYYIFKFLNVHQVFNQILFYYYNSYHGIQHIFSEVLISYKKFHYRVGVVIFMCYEIFQFGVKKGKMQFSYKYVYLFM